MLSENESPNVNNDGLDDSEFDLAELVSRLRNFRAKLKQLFTLLDDLDVCLDGVDKDFDDVLQALPAFSPAPPQEHRVRRRQLMSDGPTPELAPTRALPSMIDDVVYIQKPDGGASVRINGGATIGLMPRLALLMSALLMRDAKSSAIKGEWIAYSKIASLLGERVTNPRVRRRIAQLVYRLRNTLEENGLAPSIVETDRKHGIRLRFSPTGNGILWKP